MSREEALNKAIGILTYNQVNFCKSKEAIANMNEIIEALEKIDQEQCGDCISRDAVMHILDEVGGDFDSPREAVVPIDYIADMVAELPPVTSQPKMGHWEWMQYDGNPNIGNWHCSECNRIVCGAITSVNPIYAYKYCPTCGAKMQEAKNNENDM